MLAKRGMAQHPRSNLDLSRTHRLSVPPSGTPASSKSALARLVKYDTTSLDQFCVNSFLERITALPPFAFFLSFFSTGDTGCIDRVLRKKLLQ